MRGIPDIRGIVCRAIVLSIAAGCADRNVREITFTDGSNTRRIAVRSAFAEYLELGSLRSEIRLTLASYPVSCERWIPPPDAEAAVTVVIVLPAGSRPAAGSFAFRGVPPPEEPVREAYAVPKVLLGRRSRLLEPGGTLKLGTLQTEPHGSVTGLLAFEYPGTAERPATRLEGAFTAKMCRVALNAR